MKTKVLNAHYFSHNIQMKHNNNNEKFFYSFNDKIILLTIYKEVFAHINHSNRAKNRKEKRKKIIQNVFYFFISPLCIVQRKKKRRKQKIAFGMLYTILNYRRNVHNVQFIRLKIENFHFFYVFLLQIHIFYLKYFLHINATQNHTKKGSLRHDYFLSILDQQYAQTINSKK